VTDFRLTPVAEAEIADIVGYVTEHSGAARAEGLRRDFLRAARMLASLPRLGHMRGDLMADEVLVWPVHSFLIVYRPETRPLEIVRVISGSRDVPRAWSERVEEATNLHINWAAFVAA